jgi:hypothetical protein
VSAFAAQLRGLVDAVALPARDRAVVRGRDGALNETAVANPRGPFLGLAEALYGAHYCALSEAAPAVALDSTAFVATLRAANVIGQRYERGLPQTRELITGPGGHYVVLGRTLRAPQSGRQVRFYWNLAAAGGPAFLSALCALDRARIPFQMKVPVDPRGYARSDAGVLYLDDESVAVAGETIAAAHAALRFALRDEVPLFARRLAPGLAFAESPPTGDSFGLHRCDLIAEGLVRAFERGADGLDARIAVVRERLIEYGFDLAAFERNPASRYPYRFADVA